MLDNNKFYEELPAFEKEWKDYTQSPFVKNHINGTSALTSMYFALDLPPGSEIMVPSYTFFATCLAMRFFGCVPIFIDIRPEDRDVRPGRRQAQADAPHQGGRADALVGPALPDGRASATGPRRRGSSCWKTPPTRTAPPCRARRWAPGARWASTASRPPRSCRRVEGGMGMYQTREYFERAAAFGEYNDPGQVPQGQPRARLRRHRLRPEIPHAPARRRSGPPAAQGARRPESAWWRRTSAP